METVSSELRSCLVRGATAEATRDSEIVVQGGVLRLPRGVDVIGVYRNVEFRDVTFASANP
jgi:hypothetical protein